MYVIVVSPTKPSCAVQMFPQYKGMAQNKLFMDLRDTEIVKSRIFDDLALSSMTLADGSVYALLFDTFDVGDPGNPNAYHPRGLFRLTAGL